MSHPCSCGKEINDYKDLLCPDCQGKDIFNLKKEVKMKQINKDIIRNETLKEIGSLIDEMREVSDKRGKYSSDEYLDGRIDALTELKIKLRKKLV